MLIYRHFGFIQETLNNLAELLRKRQHSTFASEFFASGIIINVTPCVIHLLFSSQTQTTGQFRSVGSQLVAAKVSPIQISTSTERPEVTACGFFTVADDEGGLLIVTGKLNDLFKKLQYSLSHGHCQDVAAPLALFSFPPLIFTPACSSCFHMISPAQ